MLMKHLYTQLKTKNETTPPKEKTQKKKKPPPKKEKQNQQKLCKKYNLGRSFMFVQWDFAMGSGERHLLNFTSPALCPSSFSCFLNSHTINTLFMNCVFHGLGLSSGLWFFKIYLFMCGFGWHCAVSQLVCLQWMPYDDGFSHLCSTASDIAVTYVCSSPPAKPFQGKAVSVGNKHRPDPCNQCFS